MEIKAWTVDGLVVAALICAGVARLYGYKADLVALLTLLGTAMLAIWLLQPAPQLNAALDA